MRLHHDFVTPAEFTLHTVQAGPQDGALAILLHGFPEYWYGWRNQIPALAQAGYRVMAPDQRGYNLSEKPRNIQAYNLDRLAEDVLGLIDAAGRDRAFVVGHDWGAAVAWWIAIRYPQVVQKLVILNAPHPVVLRRYVKHNTKQKVRSWYIAFFQIPWLPEYLMRQIRWQAARNMMSLSSRPDTFTEHDIERYVRAWSRPRAMSSMIDWYRAAARTRTARLNDLHVRVPTRIIWGANDIALSRELAPLSLEMCDKGDLFFLEEATHWVQHDEPERVNELILDFLQNS